MQGQRRAGPRQLPVHAPLAATQGAAVTQAAKCRATVGEVEFEIHDHALTLGARRAGPPQARTREHGVGIADGEAVQPPLTSATVSRAVDGLDLDAPKLLASQLEVVDDDVECGHAARRLHQQALDRFDIGRRQGQAGQSRIHAAGVGTALGRTVLDVAPQLIRVEAATPRAIGRVLADARHQPRQLAAPRRDGLGTQRDCAWQVAVVDGGSHSGLGTRALGRLQSIGDGLPGVGINGRQVQEGMHPAFGQGRQCI